MKRNVSRVAPDASLRNTALFVAVVLAFLAVAAQSSRCGGGKVRQISEGTAAFRLAADPSMTACRLDGSRLDPATATDRRMRGQDIEGLLPAMPLLAASRGVESESPRVFASFDRSRPATRRVLRI